MRQTARQEIKALLGALPASLQGPASSIAVFYERRPSPALRKRGITADTLGFFEGAALPDSAASAPWPTRIVLFLDNIWEAAGAAELAYRQEVRTTYLHELGHYLGLEESDLAARSLD